MSLPFDADCQRAIELAKRSLPDGDPIDVVPLLAAVYYGTNQRRRLPALSRFVDQPVLRRESIDSVPVAEPLKRLLESFQVRRSSITAADLLDALLQTDEAQRYLAEHGASPLDLARLRWRSSPERKKAVEGLRAFGRVLTDLDSHDQGYATKEDLVTQLVVTLSSMKRRNALVIGPSGSGKTALIYELARRIVREDESLPDRLRGLDVFELSPGLVRAGASLAGEYEDRLKTVLGVLERHPNIVLFIDEVHTFFQSGVHSRSGWSDANEMFFKSVLANGSLSCIGCTTDTEYRHFVEPDAALVRRFEVIKVEPPTVAETKSVLAARLPRVLRYYDPLDVPGDLLEEVVALTEEYLPSRHQPDKSIRLLDRACALAIVDRPPAHLLTREHLLRALESTIGEFVRPGDLTEAALYDRLRGKIVGQDDGLRKIAQAFMAGLGSWRGKGPRGVFLFAGPTGVGKTEVALELARVLDAGRDALIRVDCGLLQGAGHEGSGQIMSRLLGASPGYIGYSPAGGGLLGKVRDKPECVVLFDEFEKAHPAVGQLLLRVLDDGVCEDSVGNLLDFRRTFVILTTNAGSKYESGLGFTQGSHRPRVDRTDLMTELQRLTGLGPEFFGRIGHTVLFQGLGRETIEEIIRRQVSGLRDLLGERGMELSCTQALLDHLAARWQDRFGVRHLIAILRNRVLERLSIADAQGELEGVRHVELALLDDPAQGGPRDLTGLATHERLGETLVIRLA